MKTWLTYFYKYVNIKKEICKQKCCINVGDRCLNCVDDNFEIWMTYRP